MLALFSAFIGLGMLVTILYVGAIAIRGMYREALTWNKPMDLPQTLGAITGIAILIFLLYLKISSL